MHAEIDCIRKASEVLSTWRLTDCTLYTTLEPCPMCMGAILNSRIKTLVYAASDSRIGACESRYNIAATYPMHSIEIIPHVLADESATLLKNFFKSRRLENSESRNVKTDLPDTVSMPVTSHDTPSDVPSLLSNAQVQVQQNVIAPYIDRGTEYLPM